MTTRSNRRKAFCVAALGATLARRPALAQAPTCTDQGLAMRRLDECNALVTGRRWSEAQRACERSMAACLRPSNTAILWSIYTRAGEPRRAAEVSGACVALHGRGLCEGARRSVCEQLFRSDPLLARCAGADPAEGVDGGAPPDAAAPAVVAPPEVGDAGSPDAPASRASDAGVDAVSHVDANVPTAGTGWRTLGWVGAGVAVACGAFGAASLFRVGSITGESQRAVADGMPCHPGYTSSDALARQCGALRDDALTWEVLGVGALVGAGLFAGASIMGFWRHADERPARTSLSPTVSAGRVTLSLTGSF